MKTSLTEKLVADFEAGKLSRRQLVARLMGLGAAMAVTADTALAQQETKSEAPTFQATGLHHIALDVTDVPRSRDFYAQHLGLRVTNGDDKALFMGAGGGFVLALFRAEKPQLNHYCYGIKNFETASAVAKLRAAGINPRETGGRVYFPDPDGLEVQIAQGR